MKHLRTIFRAPHLKAGGLALAILSVLFNVPLQAETLQTIYQDALKNDHVFKAARATKDAGIQNKAIERSALLPQINASGSWEDGKSDDNIRNITTDSSSKTLGVSLNQSIIDIGAWNLYKRGKALSELAEVNFRNAEQNLALRVSEAYFNALNAVDTLTTAKAETEALYNQLEQSEQRFEVGLTAITEVHEAQAAYDTATAQRLEAEGNLGIAFEALEVITGKQYRQLAPVKNDIPTLPPSDDRAFWVSTAIENSVDLAAAKLTMEAAKKTSLAARSGHYPTVSGELRYGQSDIERKNTPADPNDFINRDIDGEDTSVRVTLNIPLFSGLGTSARRRQAYHQYQAELENYQQAQRSVKQNTRTAYLNVLTSAASVKARKQATVSSKSALEATQAGYDVGTRDLVDVLNAQRSLYAAQRDFYNALYSYILATLELRDAAGILSGEDIANLESWLDPARANEYQTP